MFKQRRLENIEVVVAPKGVRAGVVMAWLVRRIYDKRANLGLATMIMLAVGRQQWPFFEELVAMVRAGWKTILDPQNWFSTQDDWVLQKGHLKSLTETVTRMLFEPLKISLRRCLFPTARNINDYQQRIKRCGGLNIAVFGIGAEGHFAFARKGMRYCLGLPIRMLADLASRLSNMELFGGNLESVPTEVVTIRFETVRSAQQVFLIMESRAYWDDAEKALFGPVTTNCPCSLFRSLPKGQATIILGWELAQHLRQKGYNIPKAIPRNKVRGDCF